MGLRIRGMSPELCKRGRAKATRAAPSCRSPREEEEQMIQAMERSAVPGIMQPVKRRHPETAYARREMAEFLESGLDCAEVARIPAAYNTTRLYGSLKNAAWALGDHDRRVRVLRRGSRIFLVKEKPWARI